MTELRLWVALTWVYLSKSGVSLPTEEEIKALEWLQAEGAKSCGLHHCGGLHHCKPVSFGVNVLVLIAMLIAAVIFSALVYAAFIRPTLRALF